MSDSEILAKSTSGHENSSSGPAFSARGWYHTLYRDAFRGKKILDVGCRLDQIPSITPNMEQRLHFWIS